VTLRILVAGVHGYGQIHLRNLARLRDGDADVRLAGVCDPRPLTPGLRALAGNAPEGADLPGLLAATHPDVTVIATPIHTHVDLALAAAAAGSHVLLEKPPAPSLAEFTRLEEGMRRYGRACQVGFQSFGSEAVPAARAMLAGGLIGEVTGIGVTGLWMRGGSYYTRARWAGRRWLDGVPVMDGALTNPFAHGVATALAISGSPVARTEADLYHANDIEADDTSSLRITTADGMTIGVAVTLCASRSREPEVVVRGTAGRLTVRYTLDEVVPDDGPTLVFPRVDLLENLLAHVRDPGASLIAPLKRFREFTAVVDAIAAAPAPAAIPPDGWRVADEGDEPHRVVAGIEPLVDAAASGGRLFRELGAPWAGARSGVEGGDGAGSEKNIAK